MSVKGPPHIAYGIIPKTKDRSHDRVMVTKPSLSEMGCEPRTKMKGKMPAMKVTVKLIIREESALSCPLTSDTTTEKNMKSELTRRASPTLRLIPFQFI